MNLVYAVYPKNRKEIYQTATHIYEEKGKKIVYKHAMNECAIEHLQCFAENREILAKQYGDMHMPRVWWKSRDCLGIEYIEGETLQKKMCTYLRNNDLEGFLQSICFYFEHILKGTASSVLRIEDLANAHADQRKYNVDLTFDNIICTSHGYSIIDFEWLYPNIPKQFVLYRTIIEFYIRNKELLKESGVSLEWLLDLLELKQNEKKYNEYYCMWWDFLKDDSLRNYIRIRKQVRFS